MLRCLLKKGMTLALDSHDFFDIVHILNTDMHPTLYFISLKLSLNCFGYSLVQTKIFSAFGLLSTLLLGEAGQEGFRKENGMALHTVCGVIPMVYYFSMQQRCCYSWCMFWVTLCYLAGIRLAEKKSLYNGVLFAAYNHIYVLVAVAGIAAFDEKECGSSDVFCIVTVRLG